MEYADWTPHSIVTLILGVLATIALFAVAAYVFTRGDL